MRCHQWLCRCHSSACPRSRWTVPTFIIVWSVLMYRSAWSEFESICWLLVAEIKIKGACIWFKSTKTWKPEQSYYHVPNWDLQAWGCRWRVELTSWLCNRISLTSQNTNRSYVHSKFTNFWNFCRTIPTGKLLHTATPLDLHNRNRWQMYITLSRKTCNYYTQNVWNSEVRHYIKVKGGTYVPKPTRKGPQHWSLPRPGDKFCTN